MNLSRLSLNLRFDKTTLLDPLLTFSRASSATRINPQTGLLELVAPDVPRLEKDGLLIEDAATNMSGNIASYDTSPGIAKQQQDIAPDGVSPAWLFTGGSQMAAWTAPTMTVGDVFVFSLFAKKATSRTIRITCDGGSDCVFDFDAGALAGPGALRAQPLANGWWRLSALGTATGIYAASGFYPSPDSAGATLLWGAQIEFGKNPTSHIPTDGVATTRAADLCCIDSIVGAPWLDRNQGTIVFEATAREGTTLNYPPLHITDRTGDLWVNEISVAIFWWGGWAVNVINAGASNVRQYEGSQKFRVALSWKNGQWRVCANGGDIDTFAAPFSKSGSAHGADGQRKPTPTSAPSPSSPTT